MKTLYIILFFYTLTYNSIFLLSTDVIYLDNDIKLNSINISDLIKYLGIPINDAPIIEELTRKTSVVYGNDDTISWLSVNYYIANEVVLSMESNWVDKDKINRITIHNDLFKDNNLFVGQKVGALRKQLIGSTSYPDGYLFVKYSGNSHITIELDIKNKSELYYGTSNINDIADDVMVKSIILSSTN